MRTPEEALGSLFNSASDFEKECVIVKTVLAFGKPDEEIYLDIGKLMLYRMAANALHYGYPSGRLRYSPDCETNYLRMVDTLDAVTPPAKFAPLLDKIKVPMRSSFYNDLERVLLDAHKIALGEYPTVNTCNIWNWMRETIQHVFGKTLIALSGEVKLLGDSRPIIDSILDKAVLDAGSKPQTVFGYLQKPWIILSSTSNPFAIVDLMHEVGHAIHIVTINSEKPAPGRIHIDPLVAESVAQAFTMCGLRNLGELDIVGEEMLKLMKASFIANSSNRFNSKLHFLSTVVGHNLADGLRVGAAKPFADVLRSGRAKYDDEWIKLSFGPMIDSFSQLQTC